MVLPMYACNTNELVGPTGKTDLVIEGITYQREPSCVPGIPSGVVCSGVPFFKYTIRIRNIGSRNLDQFFYISNTHSERDYRDGFCSHTAMVNNPPITLSAGDYIDVTFSDYVDEGTARVLFVINTNDLFSKGIHLPTIDELHYDNNSFTLNLQW